MSGTGRNGNQAVERTFRELSSTMKRLKDFADAHPSEMALFGELADAYNEARDRHLAACRAAKAESPLFKMTIPHTFECPDPDAARKALKKDFATYFDIKTVARTQPIRNAVKSNPDHPLTMVVVEKEGTPRLNGPKAIDLSALKE